MNDELASCRVSTPVSLLRSLSCGVEKISMVRAAIGREIFICRIGNKMQIYVYFRQLKILQICWFQLVLSTHEGRTQQSTHLCMPWGLCSTSFSIYCTTQTTQGSGKCLHEHAMGQWNIVQVRMLHHRPHDSLSHFRD